IFCLFFYNIFFLVQTIAYLVMSVVFFFFQAEDGIRDFHVTGVQTCALPILGLATVLVGRLQLPPHRTGREERGKLGHDIVEGFSWAMRHGAVRTLVATIFIFNLTFGAAWAVLVLYATRHLGLGEVGFGLVTTVQAAGGLLGILAYGWLTRHVSLTNIMRAGLVIETFTHLGLALTSSAWVAMPIFFVFGAHAFVWGTTSVTIRQRVVPTELQGRVNSV